MGLYHHPRELPVGTEIVVRVDGTERYAVALGGHLLEIRERVTRLRRALRWLVRML